MYNIACLLPVYEPTEKLIPIAKELKRQFKYVVVVDDGSSNKEEFKKCEGQGIVVLRHYINMGKGRALKTGINFICNQYQDIYGILTIDADGQHDLKSIIRCADKLTENYDKKCLVLGVRNFKESTIPLRSRFGNQVTARVLSFFCGINVTDTQTGLRGIPLGAAELSLNTGGERYEYEMNMLFSFSENGYSFEQVPIATIYEDNNKTSHFNPLKDSYKIYKTIFLYSVSSISATLIDYIVFSLVLLMGMGIWKATYIGRVFSGSVNFSINRNVVFKNNSSLVKQSLSYIGLVLISGTCSAASVSYISGLLNTNPILIKCFVEVVLYFFNFYIQRKFIFAKKTVELDRK